MDVIDVTAIHEARKFLRSALAEKLQIQFEQIYSENQEKGAYSIDPEAMGRRSLKNVCLSYLSELNTPESIQLQHKQFRKSENRFTFYSRRKGLGICMIALEMDFYFSLFHVISSCFI
jgi:aminopeptidase N